MAPDKIWIHEETSCSGRYWTHHIAMKPEYIKASLLKSPEFLKANGLQVIPEKVEDFSRADVIKVSEALIEERFYFDNSETRSYGYWCNFCRCGDNEGNSLEDPHPEKLAHKLDCPVLVAQDLLTGS